MLLRHTQTWVRPGDCLDSCLMMSMHTRTYVWSAQYEMLLGKVEADGTVRVSPLIV